MDLDGNLVSGFDVNGTLGLRVDYLNDAVLMVTPHFWNSHSLWYLNISVSRTQANDGLMGIIPKDTWLPLLPSGASVGPMPQSLNERYNTLYKTFANAWRVTDKSSLFVYAQGESTNSFTDRDWPSGQPPCNLKPQFEIPGVPILEGMPVEKAKQVCQLVTDNGLHQDCVFDVATTGDEAFARAYQITQEVKRKATAVQIVASGAGEVTATVSPLRGKEPKPKGKVIFYVDNTATSQAIALDEKGRAHWKIKHPEKDSCRIKAVYIPADPSVSSQSTSANLEYCKPGVEDGHDHDHDHDHPGGKNKGCFTWILLFLLALPFISSLFKKFKTKN